MNHELRTASATIKSFTDLHARQEGHKLVLLVYKAAKKFPREELFGLVGQMRAAAVSITSNIAEGFSRQSYAEKIHFYSISQGSTTELQNQLLVSRDVGYLSKVEFQSIAAQAIIVHKLLSGLIKQSRSIHNS